MYRLPSFTLVSMGDGSVISCKRVLSPIYFVSPKRLRNSLVVMNPCSSR